MPPKHDETEQSHRMKKKTKTKQNQKGAVTKRNRVIHTLELDACRDTRAWRALRCNTVHSLRVCWGVAGESSASMAALETQQLYE